MSESVEALPSAKIELSEEHRLVVDDAGHRSTIAMAELGAAYLEYSDAEFRFMKAKADLANARAGALEAEMGRGNTVATIAKALKLPAGEWTYDAKERTLVKGDR